MTNIWYGIYNMYSCFLCWVNNIEICSLRRGMGKKGKMGALTSQSLEYAYTHKENTSSYTNYMGVKCCCGHGRANLGICCTEFLAWISRGGRGGATWARPRLSLIVLTSTRRTLLVETQLHLLQHLGRVAHHQLHGADGLLKQLDGLLVVFAVDGLVKKNDV